jgi:NAD+ diphosphatase
MTLQPFPSNVFKYCPRCGSERFSPDSIKSLACEDCGFQYFINVEASVAGLIYNENGMLLMTYRSQEPAKGKLDLPGGFVDYGEDAMGALKREIKEELNLEVAEMDYYTSLPNEYLYGGLIYRTLDLFFTCKVNSYPDRRHRAFHYKENHWNPSEYLIIQLANSMIGDDFRFTLLKILKTEIGGL